MSVVAGAEYARANELGIEITAAFEGGAAPYSVALLINGEQADAVAMENAGSVSFACLPTAGGDCVLTVAVTDALGTTAEAGVTVPVAVDDHESEWEWSEDFEDVELSGDWREDVVAIAKTQIG